MNNLFNFKNITNFDQIINIIINILNPEKIIIFGSYAKGTAQRNSDLDILIIVKNNDEPRYKRSRKIRQYLWGLTNISKDILIYTEQEVSRWINIPFSFINTIIKEGIIVYEQ